MSISKSYNKKTGVHYAYETTYEWSEELQKKVQRRHCIGQFDPDTGEVVPNKKVGRPGVKAQPKQIKQAATGTTSEATTNKKQLANRLKKVESKLSALSSDIADLNNEIAAIRADINR
jgi:hypothetical protein